MTSGARIGFVFVASALLVVWAAAHRPVTASEDPARARAVEHYERGLDALARLDLEGLFGEMRAALEADPEYVPAMLEVAGHTGWAAALPDGERDFFERLTEGDASECARVVRAYAKTLTAPLPPTGPCVDLHVLLGGSYPVPRPDDAAEAAERLWSAFPESFRVSHWMYWYAAHARDRARLERLLEWLESAPTHPLREVMAQVVRVELLHQAGEHDEAAQLERQWRADATSRPAGARYAYTGLAAHSFFRADQAERFTAHHDSLALWALAESERLLPHADPVARTLILAARAARLLNEGRLKDALDAHDELLAAARALGNAEQEAFGLLGKGRTLVKMGRLGQAEELLLAAREVARRALSIAVRYEVEHNLLHLFDALGDESRARQAGQEFVRLTTEARLTPVRMMSYRDVGMYLQRLGDLDAAAALFDAMVATIDTLEDNHYYAGEHFESVGELDLARAYYERQDPYGQDALRAVGGLVRIAEATGDTTAAISFAREHDARVLRSYPENRPLLPGVLARSGRPEDARRAFAGARARAAERAQVASWARIAVEEARWELERSDFDRAASLADSAVTPAESVADFETALLGRAIVAFGGLRSGVVTPEEALEGIRGARDQARRAGLPMLELDLRLLEAEALRHGGRVREALTTLGVAADLARRTARSLVSDAPRAGYRAAQSRISDAALGLLLAVRLEDAPAAWTWWSVERKAPIEAPEDASLRQLDLAALEPGYAVVDYFVGRKAVGALVATAGRAQVVPLPITPERLRALTNTLTTRLAPRIGTRIDRSRARFDTASAIELHRVLVQPILPAVGEAEHLTIVPDGLLHQVPFDALLDDAAGAFLIDSHRVDIARAPSSHSTQSVPHSKGTLVFASDAPQLHVDAEARAIRSAYRDGHVAVLEDDDAVEDALARIGNRFGVLHFAGHARANHSSPDHGYVALRPSPASDGYLYAHEIRELDLSGVGLVVLSACETAGGRLLVGEGAMSLARAFLQAGAGSVVASLWPVGPGTVPFATEFHRALSNGATPADALHHAKLRLRAAGHSPFDWASFVIIREGAFGGLR